MNKYNIKYEILNYDKLNERINKAINNSLNKYKIKTHEPIGYSSCGFAVQHYSIGEGDKHIIYMGGCHGNEIISVDYVTQLMTNLASGSDVFSNFDPSKFTIDFIPCQNPEGFYTTTYALSTIFNNMNEDEIKHFCKDYYLAYKEYDSYVIGLNKIIMGFCKQYNIDKSYDNLYKLFWMKFRNKLEISVNDVINFFEEFNPKSKDLIVNLWNSYFNKESIIFQNKFLSMFDKINLDCIPEKDLAHKKLKEKLQKMYQNNSFSLSTLGNFYANADGVNLNDNNEYYYNSFKKDFIKDKVVYGKLREICTIKSIPGPLGMPNYDMNKPFVLSEENEALIKFVDSLKDKEYLFMNCHSTGGLVYAYPYYDSNENVRDFKFNINTKIASIYTDKTGEVYHSFSNDAKNYEQLDLPEEMYEKERRKYIKKSSYQVMPQPKKITGIGDILRNNYKSAFTLELSFMGGNPCGPYGDDKNVYYTIRANDEALNKVLGAFKDIEYLYDATYEIIKNGDDLSGYKASIDGYDVVYEAGKTIYKPKK